MQLDEIKKLKDNAAKGNAVSCYEMAILLSHDYYRIVSSHVLTNIHKLIKRYLDNGCVKFGFKDGKISEALEDYENHPHARTMTTLIKLILVSIADSNNRNDVTAYVNNLFPLLRQDILSQFDSTLSDWKAYQPLLDSAKSYMDAPSLAQFLDLIEKVEQYGQKYKNGRLIQDLLNASAIQGYEPAMVAICKGYGIQCKSCLSERMSATTLRLVPLMEVEKPIDTFVATGDFHTSKFKNHTLVIPKSIKYFAANPSDPNRHIELLVDSAYNESLRKAKYRLDAIISSIVIGFKGNISMEVIDLTTLGMTWDFTSCLDSKKVHITTAEKDLPATLERIDKEMKSRVTAEGNFQTRLERGMPLESPIKIFVVFDINGTISQKKYGAMIDKLFDNGNNAGYLPIFVTDRTKFLDCANVFDCQNTSMPIPATDILRIWDFPVENSNWIFQYLKEFHPSVKPKEQIQVISKDGYVLPGKNSSLSVEIGNSGNSPIEFVLDAVSHTHAFILGKSGSGKSVLLHNIVSHLIARYSPSDLELYLLDLKLGGVEFNRYKGVPHARVLLVDNSDVEIIVAIMRDIDMKMRERGKILNKAGCNNVTDYNELHPDNRLSQVIVFADECQQLFNEELRKNGNSKHHDFILNTLIKIAKEGRSQGIHLVMATQTLAGSDIPSGILNNISDFYLLNSVSSDAERLVSGSCKYTSDLATGEVYYKHVEYSTNFKGYYISKKESDDIVNGLLNDKHNPTDNKQIYLNGSQVWEISEECIPTNDNRGSIPGLLGLSIDLSQEVIELGLKSEAEHNVLFTGINETGNLSRAIMSMLVSNALYFKKNGVDGRIVVFNAYPAKEEARSCHSILTALDNKGYIEYVPRESWAKKLISVHDAVKDGCAGHPTVLYIIGQEMFAELRRDEELKNTAASDCDDAGLYDNPADMLFNNIGDFSSNTGELTYRSAIETILKDGPENGLHIVLSIDNIDKLLFSDDTPRRVIQTNFTHVVMTRTNEQAAYKIGLSDSIHPERLSDDEDRLRAIYYNSSLDKARMFTPFVTPNINSLIPE